MPGGVEPSARRVEPRLHPPVGTARTPCGRQSGSRTRRPVPKHRTLRWLAPAGRMTSATRAERRPGPKLGTAREAVDPLGDGRDTPPGRTAAPKRSSLHRRSTNLSALRPRRFCPRPPVGRSRPGDGGSPSNPQATPRGLPRAATAPKYGLGPSKPGVGTRTPTIRLMPPPGRSPGGAVSTPSDRQATLGTGAGRRGRTEVRLLAAGRTRGPVPDIGASPARRVQTEVCDRHVEGATEPSGDSGDRTSRRGRTEVRRG
jgi:hypothetical protein